MEQVQASRSFDKTDLINQTSVQSKIKRTVARSDKLSGFEVSRITNTSPRRSLWIGPPEGSINLTPLKLYKDDPKRVFGARKTTYDV